MKLSVSSVRKTVYGLTLSFCSFIHSCAFSSADQGACKLFSLSNRIFTAATRKPINSKLSHFKSAFSARQLSRRLTQRTATLLLHVLHQSSSVRCSASALQSSLGSSSPILIMNQLAKDSLPPPPPPPVSRLHQGDFQNSSHHCFPYTFISMFHGV